MILSIAVLLAFIAVFATAKPHQANILDLIVNQERKAVTTKVADMKKREKISKEHVLEATAIKKAMGLEVEGGLRAQGRGEDKPGKKLKKYTDGGFFSLQGFANKEATCPETDMEMNMVGMYNLQLGRDGCINIGDDVSFAAFPNLNECGELLLVLYNGKDCSSGGKSWDNVLEYEEVSVADLIGGQVPFDECINEETLSFLDLPLFDAAEMGIAGLVTCQMERLLPNFQMMDNQMRLSVAVYANSPECNDIISGEHKPITIGITNMYRCHYILGREEFPLGVFGQLELLPVTNDVQLVLYNNAECSTEGRLQLQLGQLTAPGEINGPCGNPLPDFLGLGTDGPEGLIEVSKVCTGCSGP